MGDIDDLQETFAVVNRHTIKQIYERLDDPTPLRVAEVLEEAAELGKVPDRDYFEMAAERGDIELVDIDLDDPLDKPPDAHPASPRNRARAEKAMRWGEENAIDKMAKKLAAQGSVDELVDFLVTVDRWGNEVLLEPERASLPTRFQVALNTAIDGTQDALLELASDRDEIGLRAAREHVGKIRNPDFRAALIKEVDGLLSLLDGSGGDIEAARSWVVDEELTPFQVAQRADQAHHRFDLSIDEYEQLVEEANALIEEAREAVEATEA